MGWTGINATHYNKRGEVDRKAECDDIYTWSDANGGCGKCEVLKSAMRGSVYYAACKRTDKDGNSYVFGAVCLTHVNSKDYFNFLYKDMDESCGPCESKCPVSILNLLSPTDHEWALAWRERCRENAQNKNDLGKLPIGTVIEYDWCGKKERAEKMRPAYQFKTPWWKIVGRNNYIQKKHIPQTFRVVNAEVFA